MENRLTKFVVKTNILSKLLSLRLSQPIFKGDAAESKESLEITVKAANCLSKIVNILNIAQALSNKSLLPSIGRFRSKELGVTRVHNKQEQVWRVLRPGHEKETKHLRWRK